MRCKSALSGAVVTMTRTIRVAQGVFAPGHLGELTQQVPFELADAVLAETGTVEQRLRDLPSRVGLYFVLALGLYAHLGYARVWDKLVAGLKDLPGLVLVEPSEKALRDLRRRIGPGAGEGVVRGARRAAGCARTRPGCGTGVGARWRSTAAVR